MPQWGTKSGFEFKPLWLTEEQKESCYATGGGWVFKHPNGNEEVIVSVRGLDTRIGAPTITKIAFGTGPFTAASTKTVRVTYNEKVAVTGTPTLVVVGSVAGNITATFTGINANGTVLTFAFTVPEVGNTLSLAAQNVLVAGATISEAKLPGTLNAEVAVAAGLATAAGAVSVVPAI